MSVIQEFADKFIKQKIQEALDAEKYEEAFSSAMVSKNKDDIYEVINICLSVGKYSFAKDLFELAEERLDRHQIIDLCKNAIDLKETETTALKLADSLMGVDETKDLIDLCKKAIKFSIIGSNKAITDIYLKRLDLSDEEKKQAGLTTEDIIKEYMSFAFSTLGYRIAQTALDKIIEESEKLDCLQDKRAALEFVRNFSSDLPVNKKHVNSFKVVKLNALNKLKELEESSPSKPKNKAGKASLPKKNNG